MISRLLKSKTDTLSAAALLVAFSSLASRLLGVLRDRILAGTFGAGSELDVYYAAFRLPDMLYNLLVLGALSAGFIPLFAKKLERWPDSRDEAWLLVNRLFNVMGFALIGLAILGLVFTEELVAFVSPGFAADKQALTAELVGIIFWSPFFLGLSGVVGGVLQSFKRFFSYALAPIFYNLGIIASALWLVPFWGVKALAWGVVLGAMLHLLIQLPAFLGLGGYRYRLAFGFKSADMISIGKLMIPRTLALAAGQLDLLISTAIASSLAAGSLAVLNLANNLQFFPIGIFGISFATAAFPVLAEKSNNHRDLLAYFQTVLKRILFFIVPSMAVFLLLSREIVGLVLAGGNFSAEAVDITAKALRFFVLSMFAQASIPLLVRVYYAKEDSLRPFFVSLLVVSVNACLAWFLAPKMGPAGLSLAFSIASIVNFLLLWFVLERRLGDLGKRQIIRSVIIFAMATVLAVLPAIFLKKLFFGGLAIIYPWPLLAESAFLAGLIGSTYLYLLKLAAVPEALNIIDRLQRIFKFKKI